MGKRRRSQAPRPSRGAPSGRWRSSLLVVVLVVAALTAFLPALRGGFVWDDEDYVLKNDSIRSLTTPSVLTMFHSYESGNYHPLTMLSLAINHAIGGLRPFGYHGFSLLLHALNAFLVFRLLRGLSGRDDAALFGAAFWALHPLRVESVAWVSGRKDLLYTAFLLLGLLAYRRYLERGESLLDYATAVVSNLLSLLSKGMAVSMALVLPLIDFVERRAVTRRRLLDKVPFFLLSLVFGLVALRAQQHAESLGAAAGRSILERVVFAAYGLVAYLWKTVWPFGLSALYPYPTREGESLPFLYFGAALLAVAIALGVAATLRRTRKVAFSFLFFFVTTLFVLKLVPVGDAVIADRYTYLSSVGLAYLVGEGWAAARGAKALSTQRSLARSFTIASLLLLGFLGALSWQRCAVWRDGITLWSDVVAKHPTASAYTNLGNARADRGDRRGAWENYEEAIRLRPDYLLAHYNKGFLAGEMGDDATAVEEFSRVLSIDPDMIFARMNRGDVYMRLGRPGDAILDYDRAIALAPDMAAAYAVRARAWLRQGDAERAASDARRAQDLGFDVDRELLREIRRRTTG